MNPQKKGKQQMLLMHGFGNLMILTKKMTKKMKKEKRQNGDMVIMSVDGPVVKNVIMILLINVHISRSVNSGNGVRESAGEFAGKFIIIGEFAIYVDSEQKMDGWH